MRVHVLYICIEYIVQCTLYPEHTLEQVRFTIQGPNRLQVHPNFSIN